MKITIMLSESATKLQSKPTTKIVKVKENPALVNSIRIALKGKKSFWEIVKALGPIVEKHFKSKHKHSEISSAVFEVLGAETTENIQEQLIAYQNKLNKVFFKALSKSKYNWLRGGDDSISDLLYYVISKGQKSYDSYMLKLQSEPTKALASLEKEDYYESFFYAFAS